MAAFDPHLDSKQERLDQRSLLLRHAIVDGLEGGGRGHLGSSLSLVEILRTLYDHVLRFKPDEPRWEERDRLILSKGHGCLALYALLADKGFFPASELLKFCKSDSFLGGHPEAGKIPGVEASTGALGHGLPIGVGMALGLRLKKSAARVFVVMGDGELNEGSVWEAAMAADKHRLGSLCCIVDYNHLQAYGPPEKVQPLEPLTDKWRSFGFDVREVNGHSVAALRQALSKHVEHPLVVIAHTVKGKGVPFAEGDPAWHHKSNLPPETMARIRDALKEA
jgi:transketolase